MSDARRWDAQLPVWVRKRDGRLEPFDPEKINRTLFAALERLNRPDAFVARELTDSVLHFLAAEGEAPTVSASDLHDWVVKVVRELGQPELAAVYAEEAGRKDRTAKSEDTSASACFAPPFSEVERWLHSDAEPEQIRQRAAGAVLESFSLSRVFSRNLTAAVSDGLLHLGGLATPRELFAAICRPFSSSDEENADALDPYAALRRIRRYVAETVSLSAPEWDLALRDVRIGEVSRLVREMNAAASLLGLRVVLNLGHDLAAPGAEENRTPTLFAEQDWEQTGERLRGLREVLAEEVLALGKTSAVGLDWHLDREDFEKSEGRLVHLVRAAIRGLPVRFVLRPHGRSVPLGDGLDSRTPALLLVVTLDLSGLYRRVGKPASAEDLAVRALSLARLAVSAGTQKRDFIRSCAQSHWPPFLLDRAAVGLRLQGLEAILAELHGPGPFHRQESWNYALQFARVFADGLRQEASRLPVPVIFADQQEILLDPSLDRDELTQLAKNVGRWHEALGGGTWLIRLPETVPDADVLLDWLRIAWKKSSVCRIGLQGPVSLDTTPSNLWP
jgi:hypothetical protein